MATIDIKPPVDRYKAIADAIREKNDTTELIHPADMPQAILDIVGDGGANYESIVYNEDDTITLTDKDGVEHTMSCTYEDGKLIGVTYDGKTVELTYDGDVLVKVGKTAVDLVNVKGAGPELLDHTVTFTVDGEPYEVVSVKDGNSVNRPATDPAKEDYSFSGWKLNSEKVTFPYVPTENTELIALFSQRMPSDYVLYVPLRQPSETAETGQELIKSGTDYTFQTVDNVPCIKFNNSYMVAYTNTLKNKDYTLSAWGKHTFTPRHNVNLYGIGAYQNDSTPFTTVGIDLQKQIWFVWENLSQVAEHTDITPTQWHHLLLTHKNGVLTFYIDGISVSSFRATQNFTSDNEEIQIGKSYVGTSVYSYGGYMSAFRVYDRALNEEEITLLSHEFEPTDR